MSAASENPYPEDAGTEDAGVTDRDVLGVRMILASRQVLDDEHIDLVDYINRQIGLTFGLEPMWVR